VKTIRRIAVASAFSILATTAVADNASEELASPADVVDAIVNGKYGWPSSIFLLIPGEPDFIELRLTHAISDTTINTDYPGNVGGKEILNEIIMYKGSTCIRTKVGGSWKDICWSS
jgi:hypothetical protein